MHDPFKSLTQNCLNLSAVILAPFVLAQPGFWSHGDPYVTIFGTLTYFGFTLGYIQSGRSLGSNLAGDYGTLNSIDRLL